MSQRFGAGGRVVVRSAQEILSTLDADGTLDSLPFMPEMLDWCGKSFRIECRVEKTCVAHEFGVMPTRRFRANEVALLEGPLCDGSGHDGCKRGCKMYWKEAWLRPIEVMDSPTQPSEPDRKLEELRARLKVKSGDSRYVCQSTEICKATEAFPGKLKPWMLRIAFKEIRNGDRSIIDVLKLFLVWSLRRIKKVMFGFSGPSGPHPKRTPTESLDLRPGELGRVKSRAEIEDTMDHKGRNRGMAISKGAMRYCGGEAEVRERLDRMIDEESGKMREVTNTVTLGPISYKPTLWDIECVCGSPPLGGCSRGELVFWREIWLERVQGSEPGVGHDSPARSS